MKYVLLYLTSYLPNPKILFLTIGLKLIAILFVLKPRVFAAAVRILTAF